MRALVEDAGKPWYAGWLSRVYRLSGALRGQRWVGGRRVRWQLAAGAVTVWHAGAAADEQRYAVRLTGTPLPSGGRRWWFHCPGCGTRVDGLFLPPGRDRLGCRTCYGLAYRSQYTRRKTRRRARRPRLEWDADFRMWIRR